MVSEGVILVKYSKETTQRLMNNSILACKESEPLNLTQVQAGG
jgi:hypothetical protein